MLSAPSVGIRACVSVLKACKVHCSLSVCFQIYYRLMIFFQFLLSRVYFTCKIFYYFE
ncbi:unnamed protein product [Brassica rapa]|uniref:Uncharacterized protein n=1 Tax=Brassica campestris TaxID=3711 RepID=A0A8D9GY46_BRACM|nr:unnamed protein product [Brassica rapa]